MNQEHPQAEILRAMAEGKTIQRRYIGRAIVPCSMREFSDCLSIVPFGDPNVELRVKPDPKKAREFWGNIYPNTPWTSFHLTRQAADLNALSSRLDCVLFREVQQ